MAPKESAKPTILEQDGFRFFFYSDDHEPVHVHVRYGGGEAIFDVGHEVDLRQSHRMKLGDLKKAQALAEENLALIMEKWHEYFG